MMLKYPSKSVANVVAWAVVCLPLLGCSQNHSPELNSDLAKESLNKFFQAWKSGQQPKDLEAGQPAIIAVDPDWTSAQKLSRYQLTGPDRSDGSNLYTSAELTLTDKAGRSFKKKSDYAVGTGAVVSIVHLQAG